MKNFTGWKYYQFGGRNIGIARDNESRGLDDEEVVAWLAAGNTPEPADVPTHTETVLAEVTALEDKYKITHRNLRDLFGMICIGLSVNPLEKNADGNYTRPALARVALIAQEIDAVKAQL